MAAAPFVEAPAMLFAGTASRGALLRGVEPQAEARVAEFDRYMRSGSLAALKPGGTASCSAAISRGRSPFRSATRWRWSRRRGSPARKDVSPRLAQLTVVGMFEAGFQDVDAGLAVLHLADTQALYRMGDAVSGVRLKLDDAFAARQVARECCRSSRPRPM